MARSSFATGNYLANVGVGQAWPYFVAGWVKIGNAATFEVAFGNSAAASTRIERLMFNSTEQLIFQAIGPSANQSLTSTALSQNVWYHVAVYADQADRELWIDGASAASGTTDIGAITFARTSLGINRYDASSVVYPMTTGTVGEFAVWGVSARLNAAEISALAAGASPVTIRPTALRSWWECFGDGGAVDRMGTCHLTETGTVTEVEGPLTSRGGAIVIPFNAATPGGGFQPAWAHRSNQMIGVG